MRWSREVSKTKLLRRETPILILFLVSVYFVEVVADMASLSEKSQFYMRYYQMDTWIAKWHILLTIYLVRLIYILFRYREKRLRYLKVVKENCLRKRYEESSTLAKPF
jgi:hypothetical protein